MKPTNNPQLNTRTYWNHIYTTPARETEYWSDNGRWGKIMAEVKDGDKFLDIGCGVGIPGRKVKKERKGCEIWGTDISDEIIKKNATEDSDITYKQGFAGYQDFLPSDYFDVVFAGEILEHLSEPDKLFSEAYRVLKTGGKFIVSTPREDAIISPEHVWEYTEDDVKKFYEDAHFSSVSFRTLDDMEHLSIIFAVGVK